MRFELIAEELSQLKIIFNFTVKCADTAACPVSELRHEQVYRGREMEVIVVGFLADQCVLGPVIYLIHKNCTCIYCLYLSLSEPVGNM